MERSFGPPGRNGDLRTAGLAGPTGVASGLPDGEVFQKFPVLTDIAADGSVADFPAWLPSPAAGSPVVIGKGARFLFLSVDGISPIAIFPAARSGGHGCRPGQ